MAISSRFLTTALLAPLAALIVVGAADAATSVTYGRITAVRTVDVDSRTATNVGTLVGGGIGLATGSGQSSSNRALRAVGGGLVGRQIGAATGRSQAFEYTVLLGGQQTITMVTDESGLRVGDCVSVERGSFNNLRLVDDARCANRSAPPSPQATRQADSCVAAKEQLLAAQTDEAFDRAERRVRLLCD
jgi:outer membrane lipoprotein SlyB